MSKQTNSYATINNSTIVPPNAFKGGTIDSERKHTTDYSKWPPSASGPEATSCSSARYSNMRLAILCCDIYICVYVLYAKNSAPMATRGQQQCINNGNAIVCYAFRSDHVQCSKLCSMACGPLTKKEKHNICRQKKMCIYVAILKIYSYTYICICVKNLRLHLC